MSGRFARVTDHDGKVHWVNLDHVRMIAELKPVKNNTARTAIHIDSYWVERQLQVIETPEEILGQR